jgi:hypothetical protein
LRLQKTFFYSIKIRPPFSARPRPFPKNPFRRANSLRNRA